MSVFDKIKNALFEEEYVEVEEKPKKQKQIKSKHKVKDKDREKVKEKVKDVNNNDDDDDIEDKPIAKKVVLPEKKEVRISDDLEDEPVSISNNTHTHTYSQSRSDSRLSNTLEHRRSEFKFVDDTSFSMEPDVIEEDPIVPPREEKRVEPEIVKVMDPEKSRFSNSFNSTKSRVKDNPLYGGSHESNTEAISIREYTGSYEKKEPVSHFKPSPIISPIYGILDKNYRKEDVPVKKEVHLTSSYARGNVSVDDVRKKAYGNLRDDLVREMDDVHEVEEEVSFPVEDDSNLLVDLSSKDDRPAVKEVTMGEAVEYFQDLGLEYNVDYVDSTKERATGRRVKEHYDILDDEENKEELSPPSIKRVQEEEFTEVEESVEEVVSTREKRIEDTLDSDDNLFDLIDSMYKEE